jgi:glycosyltransferase involved in cell wall biosynthesis
MRILAVIGEALDRSERALFTGLRETGLDLEIAGDLAAAGQAEMRAAGIPVYPLRIDHRLDLRAVRRLRAKLRSNAFDIVHATTNRGLSVALLASRGLNGRVMAYRGTMGHLSRWDPASWLTYLHPRLARIVCVSDAVRGYLLSMGLPASRLVTIHKGHDVSWYASGSHPSLIPFGVPPDAFVACFSGNMRPVKGVDVLLRAAARLPADRNVHFLLLGEVRDRRLRPLAAGLRVRDRVHWAGYRDDGPALAGSAHAFVMPSVAREGLPRAVIEAMAQGVPAIVSRVGGLPELVVDGECGLIVPPRDPDALARAVLRLADDRPLARRMGERARERIRVRFGIRETIERTLALYRELASSPPCPGSGPNR